MNFSQVTVCGNYLKVA